MRRFPHRVHALEREELPPTFRDNPEPPRFLSQELCRSIVAQVYSFVSKKGATWVDLQSRWRSDVRWARNRTNLAGEWRDETITIRRGSAWASTNQLDAMSLHAAVTSAELREREFSGNVNTGDVHLAPEMLTYPKTHIWSDSTYAMSDDERSVIANRLIAGAEQAGMLSAGYLSVRAEGIARSAYNGDRFLYAPRTFAECSLTVRDPSGRGSGWAGASSYEWGRFEAQKLAEIALEKCLRSRNPVRVEPGRYTTILEPQATFELLAPLFRSPVGYMRLDKEEDDFQRLVFHDGVRKVEVSKWANPERIGTTKIGQRVFDEHITLSFDPLDVDQGMLPWVNDGDPVAPVTWVDRGVLTNLAYDRRFALVSAHEPQGKFNTGVFHMSGGDTSIEEMIATTKRGLLVTRFWGVRELDVFSLLCAGYTRDGLWLIENGKISHPVTNLYFTESPIFAFNQVEQLGVPVPVFSPEVPAIVPPVKVRDFSFTAMTGAI